MRTIANKREIKTTIALDGEAKFKQNLKSIDGSLRVLASELGAVTSGYDKNNKSVEDLQKTNKVLEKQIELQKSKLSALQGAIDDSTKAYDAAVKKAEAMAKEFGENSEQAILAANAVMKAEKAVNGYQIQANRAQAALNKMESALKANQDEMAEMGKETEKAADKFEDVKKSKMDEALEKIKNAAEKTATALSATAKAAGKVAEVGFKTVTTAVNGGIKGLQAYTASASALAVTLGTTVVKSFGDLEQSIGGSEAVFGEFAKSIQKTGEEAYKNLGLSQNEYLETANKMGALFQGSGIEQRKSLELTEKAMQRAADVASVMGIDMQQAMDSIAGAAKGNFAMMDNLGVAMNATTIEAYALEKGINFKWNTATQAEKAEIAMQMFFERTQQYAGNFARESTETIAGSFGMLKASIKSLVAGLGNADADLENLVENVVDAFGAIASNITPVLENLAKAFPKVVNAFVKEFAKLIPELSKSISADLPEVIGEFLDGFNMLIVEIAKAIIDGLPVLVDEILPEVINSFTQLVTELVKLMPKFVPQLVNGAVTMFTGIINALNQVANALLPMLPGIVQQICDTLVANLPLIIQGGMTLLTGLITGISTNMPMLMQTIVDMMPMITNTIMVNLPLILQAGIDILLAIVNGITQMLPDLIPTIVQAVILICDVLLENLPLIIDAAIEIIVAVVQGLTEAIPTLIEYVPEIITSIVDTLMDNLPDIIDAAIEIMIAIGVAMAENTIKIASKIPEIVISIAKTFAEQDWLAIGKDMMAGIGEGIVDGLTSLIDTVKDAAGNVLDSIKGVFKIASPSKVFRDEIGLNLAAGIGVGFEDEMDKVAKDMQNAIPTDFDTAINATSNGVVAGNKTINNSSNTTVNYYISDVKITSDDDIESLAYKLEFNRLKASAAIGVS